jgi:hypothetical protein
MNWERVAIVGTAGSWVKTPWQDAGLSILSLNDAYKLPGFVRANAWFDFHPLNRFYHPEPGQQVFAHQVPSGYYVRPTDHLAWMAKQVIPLYLHPQYREQHPDAATWAHARPFPRQAIEDYFGYAPGSDDKFYSTSSPAWMLALAILEGAREIHVYGIHLATQREYIEQRPNFESLLGRVLGRGKQTVKVCDGMRHYETADGHVVLPEATPIFQADFQYAFEPCPRTAEDPLTWDLRKAQVKQQRAVQALIDRPWWKRKFPLQQDLLLAQARISDAQEALQHCQLVSAWS